MTDLQGLFENLSKHPFQSGLTSSIKLTGKIKETVGHCENHLMFDQS